MVDAKAIFDFNENLSVEAGLKNLFDENYEYAIGYPREGPDVFCESYVHLLVVKKLCLISLK